MSYKNLCSVKYVFQLANMKVGKMCIIYFISTYTNCRNWKFKWMIIFYSLFENMYIYHHLYALNSAEIQVIWKIYSQMIMTETFVSFILKKKVACKLD